MKIMSKLESIGRWICDICKVLLGLQLAAVLGIVVVQVFMRRLGHSLGWANELCCMLFIWATLLGAALASRYALHIGVDAIKDRLKGKAKKCFMIVSHSFLIIGLLIFTFSSLSYTMSQSSRVLATIPSISVGWFYCSLPICGFIMLYYTVLQLIQIVKYEDIVKIDLTESVQERKGEE